MKKILVAFAFVAASAMAWALPTVQQVEAQVQQGHLAQAETMMSEVVAAKPESARAHYIYAEILARNKNFAKASEESKAARLIDPELKFAQPDKYRAFEQLLEREQAPVVRQQASPRRSTAEPSSTGLSSLGPTTAMAVEPARSAGIPSWVWLAGLALVAFLLWRGFSRSRGAAVGPMAGSAGMVGGGQANPVNGPVNPAGVPYGSGMPAAAPGGGLLRTGMAVAGGVAGGMLLDQMLHNRGGENGANAGNNSFGNGFGSGNDGSQGNPAATELENRDVDFGSGNDWDAGSAGDIGGGSDGGGGWD